jgi:hypothetical protein
MAPNDGVDIAGTVRERRARIARPNPCWTLADWLEQNHGTGAASRSCVIAARARSKGNTVTP